MATPEVVEHGADEAGGEVVYSSDGIPPSSLLPTPPLKSSNVTFQTAKGGGTTADGGGNNTLLDSEHLEASEAFEIFAGRIYPHNDNRKKITSTTTTVGVVDGKKETPIQRLARLQNEILEVEEDIKATASSGSGDDLTAENEEALIALIKDMKQRLELSNNRIHPSQEELTRLINDRLQQFQQQSKEDTDKKDTAGTAGAGVTYELYGGKLLNVDDPMNNSTTQRLLRLEKVLGTSSGSSNKSILHRLEEMELLFDNFNDKKLEQAAAKVKIIRSDLEAASKAKNKLLLAGGGMGQSGSASGGGGGGSGAGSSSSSTSSIQNFDSKTISALYDQLNQLEGISGHLPALVNRLQQLASLHAQSATFATRLGQTEKEVTYLNTNITKLEQTLEKLEQSTKENLNTMLSNIQLLDERVNQLK